MMRWGGTMMMMTLLERLYLLSYQLHSERDMEFEFKQRVRWPWDL